MKSSIRKFLAAVLLGTALAVCSHANLTFHFPHGYGTMNDTQLTDYDESCDFDWVRGYAAPMVGWYSTTFSYGYLLTVYCDTDYPVGYYYGCAWQTNGAPVDIYIS